MKLSGVSFFKKTPKGLKVSFGRSGVTSELDWVGVASNCTMGPFWGRHLFFDWPLRDCKGNWVKLRPKQTVPWCNGLQSSRPKVILPEVMSPKTRLMSLKIFNQVARNFITLSNILTSYRTCFAS